ncbi:MAG: hypothetical protein HGA61_01045 [Candidatus Moranbacteria bacterium]|nr:hypothetical protein [Candidatus Moranbacteria bacterium]
MINNQEFGYDPEFMLAFVRELEEKRIERGDQLRFELEEEKRYIRKKQLYALLWLARRIEVKPEKIIELFLAIQEKKKIHNVYFKNKSGGGKRKIIAPIKELKYLQKRISTEILKRYSRGSESCSFGFIGGSTAQALQPHLESGCLLMFDIRDAFPSVKHRHILDLFRGLGFSWYVASFLADVATYEGCLAQGSPMSPRIFELICANYIDRPLEKIARKNEGIYTRYADNIFFSVLGDGFDERLKREIFRNICPPRSSNLKSPYCPKFQTHEFRVKKLAGNAIHALGLVIHDENVHNKREFKRRFRKAIHHAKWCLKNNYDLLPEAWGKLRGLFSYAQKDTLPAKLRSDYELLKDEILNLGIDLTI